MFVFFQFELNEKLKESHKHSCEGMSDTSIWGSQVIDPPCANNGCHPPSFLLAERLTLIPFLLGEEKINWWVRPLSWSHIIHPDARADWCCLVLAQTIPLSTSRATVTTMGQQPDKANHTWQYSQGAIIPRTRLSSSSSLHLVKMRLKEGLIWTAR